MVCLLQAFSALWCMSVENLTVKGLMAIGYINLIFRHLHIELSVIKIFSNPRVFFEIS